MSLAALCVEGLSVRLPGQAVPVLAGVDLDLRPGEVVGVCGRSGGGKSTLIGALAGLVPWARDGELRGAILLDGEGLTDLDPGQRAHLLSTCLDRPEAQLFLATPRQELAAARRLHRETPNLEATVANLGVAPLLDRRIIELSSGERQRVALAVALAAAPRPVLLDEPTTHLDAQGVAALCTALDDVAKAGGAVMLVEQAGWRLGSTVRRWLALEAGTLTPCAQPRPPLLTALREERGGDIVLRATELTVRREGRPLVAGATLELRAGELVALTGANGSGKSTLARVVAGHPPAGVEVSGSLTRAGAVALMLPGTELQLFADTVAGELALAGADEVAIGRLLAEHRLAALGGRAPWSLSRGERQRLLHAALDALEPQVLVLDEPAQGLDSDDLAALAEIVRARASSGRATVIITHREELTAAACRVLRLEGGQLRVAEGAV